MSKSFTFIVITLILASSGYARQNLVVNPSFENGNTGFVTEYNHAPGNAVNGGTYSISSRPSNAHPAPGADYADHTSGSGLQMIVNGSTDAGRLVWKQIISVSPNSDYSFSFWCASWGGLPDPNPARLRISINSQLVGFDVFVGPTGGQWVRFSSEWTSGISSTAEIEIRNIPSASTGNDFSLDDIQFVELRSCAGDANSDGRVDFSDITSVLASFGNTCP